MGCCYKCYSFSLVELVTMYALVDCNNFYVSCERVFNPVLKKKPVVVLSNNDGCIIARSNEAKSLGIPMGAPMFKYKDLLLKNNVMTYSSNYTLYGDMSSRVMSCLKNFAPEVEVYSIDEAFLCLKGLNKKFLFKEMQKMKNSVYQWTGIPVSIGIGSTKTLAKLANRIAKKQTKDGVYIISNDSKELENILKKIKVEDIWGISKRWGSRLHNLSVFTALQLKNSDPRQIKQCLSVVGEKIVRELNGVSCIPLEYIQPRKSIMVSRSFGSMISDFDNLKEALSNHIVVAASKLRSQSSLCNSICIFLQTNRFRIKEPQYRNSKEILFSEPTQNTFRLLKASDKALKLIYRPKFKYHKVGVILSQLVTKVSHPINNEMMNMMRQEKCDIQSDLFSNTFNNKKKLDRGDRFVDLIDEINSKLGKDLVVYGAQGIKKRSKKAADLRSDWQMKSYYRSPSYTTRWNELLKVS